MASIHIVRSGDTLWKISQESGLSASRIIEANGLNSPLLIPGLALYLPTPSLPERFYMVKQGDVLWELGRRYGISVSAILAANQRLIPKSLKVGQILVLPSPIKYELQTLAYFDATSSSPISQLIQNQAGLLSYVAVFAYPVQPNGTLQDLEDQTILAEIKALMIKPLMVVSNFYEGQFSPALADQVLDAEIRPTFIQSIINTVATKGYSGVSMDFEFIPPARRADYSVFLKELKTALGNAILHVNVPSKTKEMLNNRIVGAVDYQAVGNSADLVTLLTYDYGYPTGPPDPVSPPWWIVQVLTYALTQIPKGKLMMGFPLYGYDWNTETLQTTALSANAAQNKALELGIPIQYRSEQESPYYSYFNGSIKHTVWFEDSRSLIAKYRVLEGFGLTGVAFWRLRYEFPQNWEYLKMNSYVVK